MDSPLRFPARTAGSERAGMLATTGVVSADELDNAAAFAPWRGPITWQETAAGSTIAATGDAEVWEEGRWIVVHHGMVSNATEAAAALQVDTTKPAALVAAALAPERQRPSVLRGAFRAVALDRSTGEIRAIRSVGGARGLARAIGPSRISVAAEPEQAAALAGLGRKPDLDVIERYCTGGLDREAAFIAGADWLLPGSWLVADEGSLTVSLMDLAVPVVQRPRDEAVSEVAAAIENAVRRAIDGAEMLASLVTGGLDSSSLVGFAARSRKVDLALTSRIRALADSSEETELAASLSLSAAREHRVIDLNVEDLFEGVMPWLRVTGPPGVLVFGLMQAGYEEAANAGADVLLDGIGGDHAFSFNPIAEAIAESQWPAFVQAVARAPRTSLRSASQVVVPHLVRGRHHNLVLGERLREWGVHGDAAARNRYAAHLGLRLECPYLDEDVWRAVASVPPELRLPHRQLQRLAVADVVPYASHAIKAMYGDGQQEYFGLPARQANERAARYFAQNWMRALTEDR